MSENNYRCSQCGYTTDNADSLKEHSSMHQSSHRGFASRFKALGARF